MRRRTILDSTTNLLALYQHHVGESQIPMDYHIWCCLAGVAACVADRVFYQKFRRSRTTPALFTFLIGPSGVGKGDAIDVITRYLDEIPVVNQFVGNITPEAMLELMGGPAIKSPAVDGLPGRTTVDKSKIFLVTEELAMSIGTGPRAQTFVRALTGLYKRGSTKFRHATVSGANATVSKHNINWLAGTTVEWMVDSIPRDSIKGGFIGRIVPVLADYDFDKRILDPTYPGDYDEVEEHLRKRFRRLTQLSGEFTMSKRAKRIEQMWFYNRPIPTDQLFYPTFIRQHDMLLKVGMGFSLCESEALILRARHIEMAIKALATSYQAVKLIIRAASQTSDTRATDVIESLIRRRKVIREAPLIEACQHEGIPRRAINDGLQTLLLMRRIGRVDYKNKRGKLVDIAYEWQPRRVL